MTLMQIDMQGSKADKLAALAYALMTDNQHESETIIRELHGPLPITVQRDLIQKMRFVKAALNNIGELYAEPVQE